MDAQPDLLSSIRVEDYFQLHHLQHLQYEFEIRQSRSHLLTLSDFKDIIHETLQTEDFDDQLDNLFTRLNTSNEDYVDWNDFSTYILTHLRENDFMSRSKQLPFQYHPKIRHIFNNRQDTTSKILSVQNHTKYITLSKEGSISVWSTDMHEERHYEVFDVNSRRVREWVTDAVFLENCHRIAVISTGRDIRFFDITSSGQYCEEFYLYALSNVPYCCHYWFDSQNANAESLFIYGDDHGVVHILHFLKPRIQLFAVPFNKDEGVQKIYFPDLSNHEQHVVHTQLEYIHSSPIRSLQYLPDNNSVAISTSSSTNSLVIVDVRNKKKSYSFNISKGVDCFDYNKALNVLVTGSADHIVRLWNPYVTSRTIAVLQGHAMSIVDVKICEATSHVYSYSRDTVLKAWDIKEQTCIQTVFIKFPISSTFMGRVPEFGPFSMHIIPKQKSLLVTANDYIALLKLGKTTYSAKSLQPTTHYASLCGALFNPRLKLVITAADDSTIASWDILTGARCLLINQAHGSEEITSMSLDGSGKRLITAARNGTIKVWNIPNGHNLHLLEPVDEQEVTGVIAFDDKRLIIAVGWSRKIIQYTNIEPDMLNVKAHHSWKGGQVHAEDILAIAYCPPNILATASFDGDILIWSLETETLFKQLKKLPLCERWQRGVAPVDKLLFLLARAKSKCADTAILLSSEAGAIRWWDIYGKRAEYGNFCITETADQTVLGLCSTTDNKLLACGDTDGCIYVYDISTFCTQNATSVLPELKWKWSAHSAAIVSLEYIESITGNTFILSASVDFTAKLWTLSGVAVGVFGQRNLWNLTDPATWQTSEENCKLQPLDNIDTVETSNHSHAGNGIETLTELTGTAVVPDGECISPRISLGARFNDHLIRMKLDRKVRRDHLGDIDLTHTNPSKTLCCPFQAVATATLANISVPSDLPLISNMIPYNENMTS